MLAISEAVCRHREAEGIDGPLFLGRDTHALSEPATRTIVEVLGAHGVDVVLDADDGADADAGDLARDPHPQPRRRPRHGRRDRGHPVAQPARRRRLQVQPAARRPGRHRRHGRDRGRGQRAARGGARRRRARGLRERGGAPPRLRHRLRRRPRRGDRPRRDPRRRASSSASTRWAARACATGSAIAERHGLDLEIVNAELDPTFRFVPLDWDGKIRMDCSSPYAMARLTDLKDRFDVAFANDPDADRHGIVTPSAGLLNPNHHLAVCVAYLFGGAREWGEDVGVGKTVVSSSMIDRVVGDLGRRLSRCRSASSGSSTGCSTARSASAARRARAPRSCAATARSGRPTRTA